MGHLIAEYWGPILAVTTLAAIVAPTAVKLWREYQEDKRTCGPGCICAGENVRSRQQSPVVGQSHHPPVIYQPQVPQQLIYLQTQAPHPIYIQAPLLQIVCIPAPQPNPSVIARQSYYTGYSPDPTDYPQEVHYLPPSQIVGHLPPPSAAQIHAAYEARHRFEKEREGK